MFAVQSDEDSVNLLHQEAEDKKFAVLPFNLLYLLQTQYLRDFNPFYVSCCLTGKLFTK